MKLQFPPDNAEWRFKDPNARRLMRLAAAFMDLVDQSMDFDASDEAPNEHCGIGASDKLQGLLCDAAEECWRMVWERYGHCDQIEWYKPAAAPSKRKSK